MRMRQFRLNVIMAALGTAGFSAAAPQALAQGAFPTRNVQLIVPYTAGGPADLLVRGLGQKLNETWGQQVIVENKPGANEIIAAQDIAKSPADGYNFLLASDARDRDR